MKVSLNLVKKYVDVPNNIKIDDLVNDITVKTVEVEETVNTKDLYNNIVVGKILEIKDHPSSDKLKVCITDIGDENSVQIVCGGSNLYVNELVVVAKPGSRVIWHGQGDPVEIDIVNMRGVESYGMICGATEVYLKDYFKPNSDKEIVDLTNVDCKVGQNIKDVIENDDTIIEIDNKSLTNRPDLWGHYGIARELSAIYNVPLKELETTKVKDLDEYKIEIKDKNKCYRFLGLKIDNVSVKESPLWLKNYLTNAGMRSINAIVDITNYVMITTGQPSHAYDSTHIKGEKIVVRNAKKDEKLKLLDGKEMNLEEDDLVICDNETCLGLAGIKGGFKDSISPETNSILLELASFNPSTIRKTQKKLSEKTDAGIRYEKGIDTQRVDIALALSIKLFKELFPECKLVAFKDLYLEETNNNEIEISKEFLDIRLGKELSNEKIIEILENLGYSVTLNKDVFKVKAPTWRSTGDVSLKDDVLGDIARIIGYNNFDANPIDIKITEPIIQNDILLQRRIREYLSFKCDFDEIITYPWIEEKYIDILNLDKKKMVKLATPPSPETSHLRSSLLPSIIDAVIKNQRYFDNFKIYEINQVYEKGNYSPSTKDEILPVQTLKLSGAIVGKNPTDIFYELKGVLESISRETHMEELILKESTKKQDYLDKYSCMDIIKDNEVIGNFGLLKASNLLELKIKHNNVALFELDMSKLKPFTSRNNKFTHYSELPVIDKDLAIIVDKDITWEQINNIVKEYVKEVEFIEEYNGSQIPKDKKSIIFKLKIENEETTKTSEEINTILTNIINALNKEYNATLREE